MVKNETNRHGLLAVLYCAAMGMALLVVLFFDHIPFPLCPFKLLTGLPCPGCGGLRAANALLRGEILSALYINPLSCLLALFCAILPILYLHDKFRRTSFVNRILFRPYSKIATLIIVVLILCNWAWNIVKCL